LSSIPQFFKRQFQGCARYGRADLFAWKTFDKPIQQGFINFIKDDDVIAATSSVVAKKLILNKKQVLAAEVGNTYNSPVYKRNGLFATLSNTCRKQAQEEGLQIVYGLPNNLSLPGYLKRADYKLTKTSMSGHWFFLFPLNQDFKI